MKRPQLWRMSKLGFPLIVGVLLGLMVTITWADDGAWRDICFASGCLDVMQKCTGESKCVGEDCVSCLVKEPQCQNCMEAVISDSNYYRVGGKDYFYCDRNIPADLIGCKFNCRRDHKTNDSNTRCIYLSYVPVCLCGTY